MNKGALIGLAAAGLLLLFVGGGESPSPPPNPGPGPGPGPNPSPPPAVGPEPYLGAWQSNSAYITAYQNALAYLSNIAGQPSWAPGPTIGTLTSYTTSAVQAFQSYTGLTPDGEVGSLTSGMLDQMMGYNIPPGGYPIPGNGGGGLPAVNT